MKKTLQYLRLLVLALFAVPVVAHAQSGFNINDNGLDLDIGSFNLEVGDDCTGTGITIGNFDFDASTGDCGVPSGSFEVDSARNKFLNTVQINGEKYPLCRVNEEGNIVDTNNPFNVRQQTGGEYEHAVGPNWQFEVQNQGGAQLYSSCDLDFGVANQNDFRSFVIKIVNWVLTFLGLLAILAIIYAGFLYVGAGGDDGAVGTAKNIIKNAIIGIIIILLAFALVNTVIRALVGLDSDISGGSNPPPAGPQLNLIINTDPLTQGGTPRAYDTGAVYWIPLANAANTSTTGTTLPTGSTSGGVVFEIQAGMSDIEEVVWFFGDGSSKEFSGGTPAAPLSNTIAHPYGKEGAYEARVRIKNSEGRFAQSSVKFVVGGIHTKLDVVPDPSVIVGEELFMTAENSTTQIGSFLDYAWECYDITAGPITASSSVSPNCVLESTSPTPASVSGADKGTLPAVTFTQPGTYQVIVKLTTNFGHIEEETVAIEVGRDTPIASFVKPPAQGDLNAQYILDASDSENIFGRKEGLTYEWTITESATGNVIETIETQSEKTPYTFDRAGTYNIDLEVTHVYAGDIYGPATDSLTGFVVGSVIDIDFQVQPSYPSDTPSTFVAQVNNPGKQISDFQTVVWGLYSTPNPTCSASPPSTISTSGLDATFTAAQGPVGTAIFAEAGGPYYVMLTVEEFNPSTSTTETACVVKPVYVKETGQPLAIPELRVQSPITNTTTNPPILIDPVEVYRNDTLTFDSSASLGVDGSPNSNLDYTWVVDGSPLQPNQSNPDQPINSYFNTLQLGSYNIKLIVTDQTDPNLRNEKAFFVAVVNHPPEITAISVSGVTTPFNAITISVTADDPDTGIIDQYKYEILENGAIVDTQILSTSTATFDLSVYPGPHLFDVKVTVFDEDNATDSLIEYGQIAVNNLIINDPPQVTIYTNNNTGDTDTDFVFYSQVINPEPDDLLTYTWDFGDGITGSGPQPFHRYALPGTYNVTLEVDDGINTPTISNTLQAFVAQGSLSPSQLPNNGNNQPEVFLNSVAPGTNAVEGTNFAFYGHGFDVDGDALTYTWDFADGTALVTTQSPNTLHVFSGPGVYTVTLTVDDNQGLANSTNSISFDIGVGVANPVANSAPQPSITGIAPSNNGTTSTLFKFYSYASDIDGDLIAYTWDMGDGTTYNAANVSHSYAQPGSYTVQLTADDGVNAPVSVTDTIVVTAAPTAAQTAPQVAIQNVTPATTGNINTQFGFYSYVAYNGTNPLTYTWDMGDGTTYNLPNVTHTYQANGTYTVTFSVTDGVTTSTDTATMTVSSNPPVIANTPQINITNVVPQQGEAGDLFQFYSFTQNPGNSPLTYTWDMGDGVQYTLPSVSHVFQVAGTYVVTATVSDGTNTSVDTVSVTVGQPTNPQPVAPVASINSVTPGTTGVINSLFAFYGHGYDLNGDPLTYTWDMGDGTTYTGKDVTHVYTTDGLYNVTLTASDGVLDSTVSIALTVVTDPALINNTPQATITNVTPDLVGDTSTQFAFYSFVSSFDTSSVVYTWIMDDGTQYTIPNVTHTFAQPGTYTVTLQVTDGIETDTSTVVVEVLDPLARSLGATAFSTENVPPTARILGITPSTVGDTNSFFSFYSLGQDANNDPIEYKWDMGDGTRYDVANVWHRYSAPGTYTATVTTSDGEFSTSDSVEIIILEHDGELDDTFDPLNLDVLDIDTDGITDGSIGINLPGADASQTSQEDLIAGLVQTCRRQLSEEKDRLVEDLKTITDADQKADVSGRVLEIITLNTELDTDPTKVEECLGIPFEDGIIPYVTIKGTQNTRFFLYGSSPEGDSDRALFFEWDLGNGTKSVGQNAVVKYTEPGYYRVVYTVYDGVSSASDILLVLVEAPDLLEE